jgi:acetyl esterase/lipase
MHKFFLFFFLLSLSAMSFGQQVIPLYNYPIPNARTVSYEETSQILADSQILVLGNVTLPTLTIFLPSKQKANGASIVICPGGGYTCVAINHEGYAVAKKLSQSGIAAFVLKYRIPDDRSMINKEIGPLQDAQRAIQMVRQHAKQWNLDPNRVGIMGFSAGGHLASTEGTHLNQIVIENKDRVNLRPDFMILVYPVISFTDSIGHLGSRNQLLGPDPSQAKIKAYSNEWQVTANTPPTFLVHAKNDDVVQVKNSLYFYQALKENKVPTELYLFDKGGHGFGLTNPASDVQWIDLAVGWLQKEGWLRHP